MGKFSGVLIASDFDGTLTDSNGQVVQRNVDAIKYYISEGGKFTVSTGRTKIGFHNYRKDIINAPVLLANGAMAYDYDLNNAVFTNGIEKENIGVLDKILKDKFPVCMELYSVDDKAYVVNCNDASMRHFNGLGINEVITIDNISSVSFPLVKVMLSVGARTFEIQEHLKNIDLNTMKYIPCTGSFIEILSVNAGKGLALFQLADYLGIERKNIYAVGDGSNDIDMLEAAAIGFVPESGEVSAKNTADIIVGSNNIGCIGDVIEILDKKYI